MTILIELSILTAPESVTRRPIVVHARHRGGMGLPGMVNARLCGSLNIGLLDKVVRDREALDSFGDLCLGVEGG